jgi:hypothetical protein
MLVFDRGDTPPAHGWWCWRLPSLASASCRGKFTTHSEQAMTIGRHRFSGSFAVLALLASCGLAQAAVPPAQISYQGELSNNGSPANGLFNMTFRFYDAANAGTLIMSEVKAGANLVQVTNGLFSTTLGTNGSILDAAGGGVYNNYADLLRDFSQVWVEVEVGGNTLSPRQRMVAAPYALNATRAATLDDVDVAAGSLWQVQGVGSTLTIDGNDVRLRLGGSGADRVSVPSNLYMMHEGAADSDQRLSFTNNGVSGAELLQQPGRSLLAIRHGHRSVQRHERDRRRADQRRHRSAQQHHRERQHPDAFQRGGGRREHLLPRGWERYGRSHPLGQLHGQVLLERRGGDRGQPDPERSGRRF